MKAVAVLAGILLLMAGALVLAVRFGLVPTDMLGSVQGASTFVVSDTATFAGVGGVGVGLILIVLGALPKRDKFAGPSPASRLALAARPAAPAPAPAAATASAPVPKKPEPPPYAPGTAGDPATWEHYTGAYEFEGTRVTSSEMFGVRRARRMPLKPGDMFKVRARIAVTKDAPVPERNTVYVGVAAFDTGGAHIGHYYNVAGEVQTASQGAVTFERTFDAATMLDVPGLGTTAAISPAILLNYDVDGGSSGAVSGCDLCELTSA